MCSKVKKYYWSYSSRLIPLKNVINVTVTSQLYEISERYMQSKNLTLKKYRLQWPNCKSTFMEAEICRLIRRWPCLFNWYLRINVIKTCKFWSFSTWFGSRKFWMVFFETSLEKKIQRKLFLSNPLFQDAHRHVPYVETTQDAFHAYSIEMWRKGSPAYVSREEGREGRSQMLSSSSRRISLRPRANCSLVGTENLSRRRQGWFPGWNFGGRIFESDPLCNFAYLFVVFSAVVLSEDNALLWQYWC